MEDHPPAEQSRWQMIASEAFAFTEIASLRIDPIYRGEGVPRGDGRLVVIIPGLFGSDFYLWPLRRWISRIGFRASTSGLWVNVGCPDRLTSDIEQWIERQEPRHDRPLVLIGHSRGGLLARALAVRLGRRVSHLVTLGSPVGLVSAFAELGNVPPIAHPTMSTVWNASNAARRVLDPQCHFPDCGCEFVDNMRASLAPETTVLSIYSREDPIVPPQASIVTGARNVEVTGTHSGLVYNPAVYRELARSLP
ncbi:MAG: alpha/beta fold hydrolase [Candidatus Binatus sp.]|jgi:triacylglycerol lipase|uniref:esterase/lipase family protein n=1 Tax=Candidatus Binatus sp. TaxID=2811406 RepID=UPI003C9F75B0